MPIFNKPTFFKKSLPSGEKQACYEFTVETALNDKDLEVMLESKEELIPNVFKQLLNDNREWIMDLIKEFLHTHASLFSKSYTVESIYKIVKHELLPLDSASIVYPSIVTFLPSIIVIIGGTFYIKWAYRSQPAYIDIPDPVDTSTDRCDLPLTSTSTLPVLKNDGLMEEINMDDIPLDTHATDTTMDATVAIRQADRNRVKEARLKSRIAMYRVQLQLRQYYEKYGEEYEDSEYDTDHSISDEDVEDIQL